MISVLRDDIRAIRDRARFRRWRATVAAWLCLLAERIDPIPAEVVETIKAEAALCPGQFTDADATWMCELPVGHAGMHGVPRFGKWGP